MAAKSCDKQLTAAQALSRLKEGNDRFIRDELQHNLQDVSRRVEMKNKQCPWAVVLTCADSRVVPELAFDTGISELFVVRVAGNTANTCSLASIEYAVANLNVKLVVVLGHEGCGAIQAAIEGSDLGYNLNHLLAHIKPAVDKPFRARSKTTKVTEAVKRNAKHSAQQLAERSSILSSAKGLKIVPAIYKLATGEVDYL